MDRLILQIAMLGGKVAEIPSAPRTGPMPRGPATKPMEVTEVSRFAFILIICNHRDIPTCIICLSHNLQLHSSFCTVPKQGCGRSCFAKKGPGKIDFI